MTDNSRNIIGIAMDLDVTDLKAGLQESRKEISTANKQFAAATSGMDDWTKSSEGLNAKLQQLDTVLKNQKRNVAGIEAELERSKRQYGENSEQVRRLKDQLLDAQAAVGKTEKSQRKYTTALQQLETQERETANETRNLNTSLKQTGSATEALKGGFTVLKGALAGLVTVGITSFVSGLKSAIEETREFRRELAYLEQGAEAAGVSFDKAKEKVKEVTAITEDQGAAVEGLNNLMTAGFDGAALDKITDQLVGASIQWKDTLKFEGLSDGLQETLATGKAIGPFVELLERGGIVAEDFDANMAALSTSAERQQYVMNTLSKLGLEGVTEGYREANKGLIEGAEANFAYSDAMAQVSEKVEPLFSAFKQGWTDVLNAFLDMDSGMNLDGLKSGIKGAFQWFIDNVIPTIKEGIQYVVANKDVIKTAVETLGTALSEAFKYFVDEILPAIKDGIKFAIDNKDGILAAVIAIGGAFLGWKIGSIVGTAITALTDFKNTLMAVRTGQMALNAAMLANPIGLILGLIAGLVAAFITLWNTSDEFRGFWIGLWDKIKAAVQPVIDFLAPAFANAWENIKVVWGVVVDYFTMVWENIKGIFSVVTSVLSGDFEGAWEAIKGIWDNVVEYFTGIFDGIKNIFAPEKTNEAIANPFSGALDTIKGAWEGVTDWFSDKFDGIKKAVAPIDEALGSPFSNAWESIKVVWDLAKGYFQLIWDNIKLIFSVVKSVLSGNFGDAWEGIKKIWDNTKSYFSDIIETIFGYFAELPDRFISIGSDMIDGLVSGVTNAAGRLADAARNAVSSAVSAAKNFLDINSPSKKTENEVGIPFGQGIGVGLLKSMKYVAKDIGKFNNELVSKASEIQSGLTLPTANSNGVMGAQAASNNVVNNNNYTQVINAPKQPSRIELYRQTKNLLALRGGYNV